MTDSNDPCSNLCVDYLHPEILSSEALILILNERKIRINETEKLDKCKLLQIFYDNILPLSQRIYGLGRRAKRIAKARQLQEVQNSKEKPKDSALGSKNGGRQLIMSSSDTTEYKNSPKFFTNSANNERLKPPPISSNKNKTIKLNSEDYKRKIPENEQFTDKETKKPKHTPITW